MPKTPHSSLNLSSMISGHPFLREICARSQSDHAVRPRRRDTSTAIARRRPRSADDCRPSRRSRVPARRRRRRARSTSVTLSGAIETTTRDADSPKSAAATFDRGVARHADGVERHLGADAAGVEAAFGERDRKAAVGTVVRRSHEALVGERRRAAAAAPARRARSSAGGTPRTRPCTSSDTRCRRARRGLSPSSTITSPAPLGTVAAATRSACSSRPTTPMTGVG